MGNSLGKLFTVTSFGESHGRCVGVVIDGCPAGLPIVKDDIQRELDKRKPVSGTFATTRKEADNVEILSGIFNGFTTGAPICLLVWNKDVDSGALYDEFLPRPGHADYTARMKYGGFNDYRGGGRFSGRITAGFVMAGAVAKQLLIRTGVEILVHTVEIGGIKAEPKSYAEIKRISPVTRCIAPTTPRRIRCWKLSVKPLKLAILLAVSSKGSLLICRSAWENRCSIPWKANWRKPCSLFLRLKGLSSVRAFHCQARLGE